MKELMDIDSKQNQTTAEHLRQSENVQACGLTRQPPEPSPQPRGRRFVIVLAIFLSVVVGVVAWQHWAARSKVPSAVAQPSNVITDFVVLDESQLRQVSVEPVSCRTIIVARNATGKVGFNEDRLTPVFTP